MTRQEEVVGKLGAALLAPVLVAAVRLLHVLVQALLGAEGLGALTALLGSPFTNFLFIQTKMYITF